MGPNTWNAGGDGDWNVDANWSYGRAPIAGDPISLPDLGFPYTVSVSGDLSIGGSLTLGSDGSSSGPILSVGGVLTVGGAISGYGEVDAKVGGISGGGSITASGGALAVNGDLTGVVLQIDGSAVGGSSLALNGQDYANALDLSNSVGNGQTLEVAGGALTITGAETVAAGATIQLDGIASVTDAKGFVVNGSGEITGSGVLTGDISGDGVVNAVNGTLTVIGNVDTGASGVTNFTIGDALGDGGVLDFESSKLSGPIQIGGAGGDPTITFEDNAGTLDLSHVTAAQTHISLVADFVKGDQILIQDLGGGKDTVSFDKSNDTLTVTGANSSSESFKLAGNTTGWDQNLGFTVSDAGGIDTITICFMAGTMIATATGEVAIETLQRGDMVLTSDGRTMPVSWLGRQTVAARFADPVRNWPIRVKAGALGENVPSRDLLVSPDHALLVEGVLIHAGALINGASVVRETTVPETFVYYHVELDDHSLILAENTPAETFVDNVDRMNFDNWNEHEALYPEGKAIVEMPYPRAKAHRQVPVAIRTALAARAEIIGAVAAFNAVA